MNWSTEWKEAETVIWDDGTVVGDLVVHKGSDILGWVVSHVSTEASFMSAVPENSSWKRYTKQELVDWCTVVQQGFPDVWEVIGRLTPDNYEDNLKDERYELREWCLSVSVRETK